MPQEMSLVAFNNQIARYSKTHHIETHGVVINSKQGIVKFDKMVLTPIDSYERIMSKKHEAKYSQYGSDSDDDRRWDWIKFWVYEAIMTKFTVRLESLLP